ncbi:tetratricopeptide repeat protein [Haliangium sp.]|uniref:tetratricopeptide repeat protein n=1 Tax=Haliangium sp. TaxID=2663208 RepID=UPI003D100EAD
MTTHRAVCILLAALVIAPGVIAPGVASAQSAAERAAQLNDEGKKLWDEQEDVAAAAEKFRQATLLSPEGRYYFNLCYALYQLSRYREARTACQSVQRNTTDERLLEKSDLVLQDIASRLPNEPPPDPGPDGTDPGDPGTDPGTDPDADPYDPDPYDPDADPGDPGSDPYDPNDPGGEGQPIGYQGPGSAPPAVVPGLERTAKPNDEYSWSLGASIGFLGASIGREGDYAGSGVNVQFDANFIIAPRRQLGLQGYLGITQVAEDLAPSAITIVDIGAAAFKHIRRQRFYVTPLAGAHLTLMQPEDALEGVATGGLHGQVSFSWILGAQRNHVLSVSPTLNLYFPGSGIDAEAFGLDEASATIAVNFGYTLRFMTPFGSSPLIILE